MKEYLIFKLIINNEVYIDAYRIDDKPIFWLDITLEFEEFAYISSPSRTEAKRVAYQSWIDKDLIGFKDWHYRVMNKHFINSI